MLDSINNMMPEIRRWCIFTWGDVWHPVCNFTVDEHFARAMVDTFDTMAARGYHPPILREHKAEGIIFGKVIKLEIEPDGLYATAALTRWLARLFDDGFLDNWSPGFRILFKDPHTQGWITNFLRDLSFVGVGQLKNLPGASEYYHALDVLSLAEYEDASMDEILNQILAKLSAIENRNASADTRLEDVVARLDALSAQPPVPAPPVEDAPAEDMPSEDAPAEDMPSEDEQVDLADAPAPAPAPVPVPENADEDVNLSEVYALRNEVVELRTALNLANRNRTMLEIKQALPELDDAAVLALAESPEGSRDVLMNAMRASKSKGSAPTRERGTPGVPESNDPVTVVSRLREKGVGGAALVHELSERGFNVSDPVIAALLGRKSK